MIKQERLERLIELLADGEFHSGEELGQTMGVSRASINQYISGLDEIGLTPYKVVGRGYKLPFVLQLLNEAKVKQQLDKTQPMPPFAIHRVVTSTNDVLKDGLTANSPAGTCIVAEAQTAGRGRRGRRWHSPFGTNLYLSMYWPLEQGLNGAMGLSVAIGVALARLLEQAGVANVQLKWPNDIHIAGKKIAGILVELEGSAGEQARAVVGIGLNMSMPAASDESAIDQPWTDLTKELPKPLNRNEWVARLIQACAATLRDYDDTGLSSFMDDWQHFDRFMNKEVRLIFGQREVVGYAKGIDKDGALLVTHDGATHRYHSGELSIRGTDEVIN